MTSDVEVANSALVLLGSSSILALSDTSKEGRNIALVFNSCRQFIIRSHPWNFACDRVTLAPSTDLPAFGFANKFPFPTLWLRTLLINDGTLDYKIEGKFILCDESTIELRYLKDVPDIQQWDALAAEAFSTYLAWKICYALTASSTLKDQLYKDFFLLLKKARNVDAQEEPAAELEANDYLESRIGFNQGFVRDPQT